jgi:phytol kinase
VNPALAISFVLAALGALVGGVKLVQARGRVDAEVARKLVHVGMGCVCLSFPWLFEELWPVWLLAGLAVAGLAALRLVPALRHRVGDVLHGVKRASLGEVYFPLGVAAVFTLAGGNVLLFTIPVALLTFADAAGALVGKRWGRHHFETLEGRKSLEGSAAVGAVSLVCVSVPLLAAGHTWPHALLVAAVMGVFGLLIEAIAWRGLDNVFLPLVAFAQLSVYLGLEMGPLIARLLVLLALVGLAILWRRGALIDHGARLGAAATLFFFWAVGGWPWLIAPMLLITSYARLMPVIPGGAPRHNLVAVLCVGSAALPWAVAHALQPGGAWLWPYTVGLATQQAIITTVRFAQAWANWSRGRAAFVGWLHAVAIQLIIGSALASATESATKLLATGAVAVGVGLSAFLIAEPKLQQPDDLNARWWKQGLSAVGAAVLALVLLV